MSQDLHLVGDPSGVAEHVGDTADAPPSRKHRVLVVDDCELVQAGMRSLLLQEEWVESCFCAGSAEAAFELLRRCRPHVVIIELALGADSGLHLARRIRSSSPHVRIILMSSQGRVSVSEATANGAAGFIPKNIPAQGVVLATRQVALGGRVFPRRDDESCRVSLSPRERDVLQHLVSGLSNPEVAAQLFLSRHTVKQHTSALYRKLGVRNRAQAASRARELGLVA
jgi:two-component system response regulator DesR